MASSSFLLGYDVGSTSVKATLLDAESGKAVASAASPQRELEIMAPRPGWAEQDPEVWWEHVKRATRLVGERSRDSLGGVKAVGITYQMHGLVVVDEALRALRPSIIWCDSRAVPIGERAFREIGEERCLRRLLNSPGNFTASKLRWVRENQPDIYGRIHKMMLPGDYIAMRMTGEAVTTPSGLSEMILWDYLEGDIAGLVLDYYDISPDLLPRVKPTFSVQGELTPEAAEELGLGPGVVVSYRAGDQANNAFSLGVLEPGEAAATAGTSGVVYGIYDRPMYDPGSRVNTFIHVNHGKDNPRYGILLCVNGTGILNSWLRKALAVGSEPPHYDHMNEMAASVPVGSEGLVILPYGNGAERSLGDRNIGASVHGLDFNIHEAAHMMRAAQEGIVFALNYGMGIMGEMGMEISRVRAGFTNMFLSPLFVEAFCNTTGCVVELYDTDGSQGAARGAGLGCGLYRGFGEALQGLKSLRTIEPEPRLMAAYGESYARWSRVLDSCLEQA